MPGREPAPDTSCGVCPWDEPANGTNQPGAGAVSGVPQPGGAPAGGVAQGGGPSQASGISPAVSQTGASVQSVPQGVSPAVPTIAQAAGLPEVKKPTISIPSTSEDPGNICPWETSAPEPEKTLDVRSRKNSTQFDSGSSSSDISLAIAEVSDRLRRTCGISQQNTLDGDKKGQVRRLSTASCVEPRRSSISIPPNRLFSDRPSVSSFEESGSCSLLIAPPSEKDIEDAKVKGLVKTPSVSGASVAPIISVSSAVDETFPPDEELPKLKPASVVKELELPLAPLAVPDSESPGSDWVPEIPAVEPQETEEAIVDKQKEICPWEDE